jgi:hypothetical protein
VPETDIFTVKIFIGLEGVAVDGLKSVATYHKHLKFMKSSGRFERGLFKMVRHVLIRRDT